MLEAGGREGTGVAASASSPELQRDVSSRPVRKRLSFRLSNGLSRFSARYKRRFV